MRDDAAWSAYEADWVRRHCLAGPPALRRLRGTPSYRAAEAQFLRGGSDRVVDMQLEAAVLEIARPPKTKRQRGRRPQNGPKKTR